MRTPFQRFCEFAECTAQASHGFAEPGPARAGMVEVWTCAVHADAGPGLLAVKVEERNRGVATDLRVKAARGEGKLI